MSSSSANLVSTSNVRSPPLLVEEPRKRRKLRAQLSCGECRRLKLKCDRIEPCANCVRRERADLCRLGVRPNALFSNRRVDRQTEEMQQHPEHLETSSTNNGISIPQDPLRVRAVTISRAVDSAQRYDTLSPYQAPAQASVILGPDVLVDRHGVNPRNPFDYSVGDQSFQMQMDPFDHSTHSHGTLLISHSGRSTYLGRTAAAEWLKNQEVIESGESPPPKTRPPSPGPRMYGNDPSPTVPEDGMSGNMTFPFTAGFRTMSTAALLRQLPHETDGRLLVDSYYRHFAWHFNILSRHGFTPIFDKIYTHVRDETDRATSRQIRPEQLALLYIVLAMGSYYNLEISADSSEIEDYLKLSQLCLVKADFLANKTLQGVQTLFIMAHLQQGMESGKNGEFSWPLWGLTTRTLHAMGLHRDGERWNLPQDIVEERRWIFWECHTTDLMASNSFSRPGAINPDYIDTSYPKRPSADQVDSDNYHRAKFESSKFFGAVLDHVLRVHVPAYTEVQSLHQQITAFEQALPFALKCRPVMCVLLSIYPEMSSAIDASPAIKKRDFQKTFQQFTMSMHVSELLLFLHRPYFARALHDSSEDPSHSSYGTSYLAVLERCNAIVVIATELFSMYPQVAARHWWIWYHTFNAAACMSALILKNPRNVLCAFASNLVDSALEVYGSASQIRNSPRMSKSHQWLLQAQHKVHNLRESASGEGNIPMEVTPASDDVEILGWKTRLIQRAENGPQIASTITPMSNTATGVSPGLNIDVFASTPASTQQRIMGSTNSNDAETVIPIWDPFALASVDSSQSNPVTNWWGFGSLDDLSVFEDLNRIFDQ